MPGEKIPQHHKNRPQTVGGKGEYGKAVYQKYKGRGYTQCQEHGGEKTGSVNKAGGKPQSYRLWKNKSDNEYWGAPEEGAANSVGGYL